MKRAGIVLCWDVPIISPLIEFFLPMKEDSLGFLSEAKTEPRPDGEKGKIGGSRHKGK